MREVRTSEQLDTWLAEESRPPAAVQDLDLRDESALESGRFDDCLFLSCDLTPAQAGFLTMVGATVIGDNGERPFSLYRSQLYTPAELFAGFDVDRPESYADTLDAVVYRHFVETGRQLPQSISESLARRLHDFSITESLGDALAGHRPVAIMGGHAVERADPLYAAVAAMSRSLARSGYLMLSGGGPGVMEATHLGVWFAGRDDGDLDDAIAMLAPRPLGAELGREYADGDWLQRAYRVRERFPWTGNATNTSSNTGDAGSDHDGYISIGIPTWAYGHEPPSAFATLLAKYFQNSIREDGLLAAALHGVVFTPGSAGTIQEIFQDGAQNHYATFGPASPMVLFGVDYWTNIHPVWPVLESLADGKPYRSLLLLTDDADEAIEFIHDHQRQQ